VGCLSQSDIEIWCEGVGHDSFMTLLLRVDGSYAIAKPRKSLALKGKVFQSMVVF
jgi:hypothetical protein